MAGSLHLPIAKQALAIQPQSWLSPRHKIQFERAYQMQETSISELSRWTPQRLNLLRARHMTINISDLSGPHVE